MVIKEGKVLQQKQLRKKKLSSPAGQAFLATDESAIPKILGIAIGSPDHKILVAAFQAAGIENVLIFQFSPGIGSSVKKITGRQTSLCATGALSVADGMHRACISFRCAV